MKHLHTCETPDRKKQQPDPGSINVQPSVLSILFYLEELEAQVPITEHDISNDQIPASRLE